MILMCVIMLYFMLFTDLMKENMHVQKRMLFSLILGLYAAYRSYRLYIFLKKN
jgi:hypothetical protein